VALEQVSRGRFAVTCGIGRAKAPASLGFDTVKSSEACDALDAKGIKEIKGVEIKGVRAL
jgi:hypothetical protein